MKKEDKKQEGSIRIFDDVYLVSVHCTNCERDFTASIPKGRTVEESMETEPSCPNCKCKTLVAVRK